MDGDETDGAEPSASTEQPQDGHSQDPQPSPVLPSASQQSCSPAGGRRHSDFDLGGATSGYTARRPENIKWEQQTAFRRASIAGPSTFHAQDLTPASSSGRQGTPPSTGKIKWKKVRQSVVLGSMAAKQLQLQVGLRDGAPPPASLQWLLDVKPLDNEIDELKDLATKLELASPVVQLPNDTPDWKLEAEKLMATMLAQDKRKSAHLRQQEVLTILRKMLDRRGSSAWHGTTAELPFTKIELPLRIARSTDGIDYVRLIVALCVYSDSSMPDWYKGHVAERQCRKMFEKAQEQASVNFKAQNSVPDHAVFEHMRADPEFENKYRQNLHLFCNEPGSSYGARGWSVLMMVAILASVAGFILETVPELTKLDAWKQLELVCVVLFTIEYCCRLLVADKKFAFIMKFLNIVDLLAVLPFYVMLILKHAFGLTDENTPNLQVVRVVRMMRVFRILKLSKFCAGITLIADTMSRSLPALSVLMITILILVICFSALMYFIENGKYDPLNCATRHEAALLGRNQMCPHHFESIPATFWWCFTTMTTVGYGDAYPASFWGQLIAICVMLSGLLIIALPTTVLAANFASVYHEFDKKIWTIERERKFEKKGYKSKGRQGVDFAWVIEQLARLESEAKKQVELGVLLRTDPMYERASFVVISTPSPPCESCLDCGYRRPGSIKRPPPGWNPARYFYKIGVVTGNERDAGTDANVTLTMIGSMANSGVLKLSRSLDHVNKFERNSRDTFVFELPNLGALECVSLSHDGKGFMSKNWLLDKVTVSRTKDGVLPEMVNMVSNRLPSQFQAVTPNMKRSSSIFEDELLHEELGEFECRRFLSKVGEVDPVVFLFKDQEPILSKRGAPLPQLMADLLKSLSHSQQQLAVQEAGHCSSEHSQRNGDLSPHADGHDVPEIDAAGRMLGHMAERATSVAVDASPAFDASVHGRWLYNASDPGDVADTDYFDPNGTCLHDASWI